MGIRAITSQAAACLAVLLVANVAVQRFSRNSVPRQVLRSVAQTDEATHAFFGNSLMASGLDPAAFARGRPDCRPLNLGLGASSPVEDLILLKSAEKYRAAVVVYGYFDRQMTDPAPRRWGDLFGNRAMGYYADLDTAVKYYAAGDAAMAAEMRATALVPFLVERGAVWGKVEALRRRLGGLGLPAVAENQFGRAADFAALEASDPQEFAARAAAAARDGVPLGPAVAEFVRLAGEQHAGLVVVEMPMPSDHRRRFYAGPEWAAYREHVATLVRQAGGRHVDASDWVADGGFADALHMNEAGAVQFSRRLSDEIAG
jgi:hypothetical protein